MKRLAALMGVSLSAAALSVVAGAPAQAADDSFYTPPTTLPKANGTIIKSEPQKLVIEISQDGQAEKLPGKGTRIMYKSTNQAGKAVAVTGTYIEPTKAWTGTGARPLVGFASGTQGQGDTCAPSKTLSSAIVVKPGSFALGYEVPTIYGLLDKGMAVVVTDYIGLGNPDVLHTYTNRTDLGNATLDAVRAAKKLPGTSLTSSSAIGLYGYSQGGGATGAAAELAPTYAPELKIAGAYVGAPTADLLAILKKVDGTSLTGVIGYAINGLIEYSPALKTILDKETNAAGKAALANSKDLCTADSLFQYAFKKTTEWTASGKTAVDVVNKYPEALAAVEKQKLGKVKNSFPTMILTGTQDDIVDHAQAKQLAKDWCAKGGNVKYEPAIQAFPSGGTGLNHITPIFVDSGKAFSWLTDRFNGKAASSNCLLVPILP